MATQCPVCKGTGKTSCPVCAGKGGIINLNSSTVLHNFEEGRLGSLHVGVSYPSKDERFCYLIRDNTIVGVIRIEPGQTKGDTTLNVPVSPGDKLSLALGMLWASEKPSLWERIKGFFRVNIFRLSLVLKSASGMVSLIFVEKR